MFAFQDFSFRYCVLINKYFGIPLNICVGEEERGSLEFCTCACISSWNWTGPHYECDNKHVSSNEACKMTNCIIEMFLNLIQGRGQEKEGEKRANWKKQHSLPLAGHKHNSWGWWLREKPKKGCTRMTIIGQHICCVSRQFTHLTTWCGTCTAQSQMVKQIKTKV
jgi:hypothetical protein